MKNPFSSPIETERYFNFFKGTFYNLTPIIYWLFLLRQFYKAPYKVITSFMFLIFNLFNTIK